MFTRYVTTVIKHDIGHFETNRADFSYDLPSSSVI